MIELKFKFNPVKDVVYATVTAIRGRDIVYTINVHSNEFGEGSDTSVGHEHMSDDEWDRIRICLRHYRMGMIKQKEGRLFCE